MSDEKHSGQRRMTSGIDCDIPEGIAGRQLQLLNTDAGELWFPVEDHVMRDYIRNAGTWEPQIGNLMRAIFPRRNGVFLDIGANVGYFSALIAKHFPSAAIYAFEPHPVTYKVLRLNIWKYNGRIRLFPCALGDCHGTVALTTSESNIGDTRGAVAENESFASVVAPVAPLDELITEERVDVVKIDVQGAEFSVLAGMRQLIRRSSGVRIIMEFCPGLLAIAHLDARSALTALRSEGFGIGLIRPDGLVDADDREILDFCYSAGTMGQANLLLTYRG